MTQIVVVNLNPCIDWQYNVPEIKIGETNRVCHTYAGAASKATNVSIVLKNLGLSPYVIGFNYMDGRDKVRARFDEYNIPYTFEMVDGAVRINIKVLEEVTGQMTELNQPGAVISSENLENFMTEFMAISHNCDADSILVLTGSLPQGVPSNFYMQLCDIWQGKVFVDADGEVLYHAINAKNAPYFIKPNIHELGRAFGVALENKQDVISLCQSKVCRGDNLVCVSMGKDGAVLLSQGEVLSCDAIDVTVRGVQGAGDSMLAGMIYGLVNKFGLSEVLRSGIIAAAGTVECDGTGLCTLDDYLRLGGMV